MEQLRPKGKIEERGLHKQAVELISKGYSDSDIVKELAKDGHVVTKGGVASFRRRALTGVLETEVLDNLKPISTVIANKYLETGRLMAENLDELTSKMVSIEDNSEWLEFLKEKRAHIELLMRKAGDLNTVNQAVQVNVANVITPNQFAGKANDYLFSLVKDGKVSLVSNDLKQEYAKWLK